MAETWKRGCRVSPQFIWGQDYFRILFHFMSIAPITTALHSPFIFIIIISLLTLLFCRSFIQDFILRATGA
jgi:hypothetical protein